MPDTNLVVVTEGSELCQNRREQFAALAEFLALDRIVYTDKGNCEEVLLIIGNQYVKLIANGNKYDGGWLSVHSPMEESK
jgi:hypothetical protein